MTEKTTSNVMITATMRGSRNRLTWKSWIGETRATMNSATTNGIITARV